MDRQQQAAKRTPIEDLAHFCVLVARMPLWLPARAYEKELSNCRTCFWRRCCPRFLLGLWSQKLHCRINLTLTKQCTRHKQHIFAEMLSQNPCSHAEAVLPKNVLFQDSALAETLVRTNMRIPCSYGYHPETRHPAIASNPKAIRCSDELKVKWFLAPQVWDSKVLSSST